MPLHTEKRARERILAMGPAGTGKSSAWLSIADQSQKTGSDATFFVLDTDRALDRMLDEEYPDLTNVEWKPAFEWEDYAENLDEFIKIAKPDDWIIIDMLTPAWQSVQEYFVRRIFGKEMDEFFLEARQNMKKGSPLDGFKDWQVINRLYRAFMNNLIHKSPCHVFCTAGVDAISDNDDKAIRVTFGAYGVKPRGQKEVAHSFHTVLLAGCKRPGEHYTLTTVKDRGREPLVGHQVGSFAIDYIVAKAGFKLL